MKKLFTFFYFIFFVFSLFSQETDTTKCKTTFDVSSDFMSRYVWRGTDFGRSPSIQPSMIINNGGFNIGAWGAFSVDRDYPVSEVDLYVNYTYNDMISVTVYDYFFPDETLPSNYYFRYDSLTGHVYESTLAFLGTEKIPFNFLFGYNFCGADKLNSMYLELGYTTSVKNVDCNLFTGFTPYEGIYADGPGFVNCGINAKKNIEITDKFSLPVSLSLITNPSTENIFFVFGISLK